MSLRHLHRGVVGLAALVTLAGCVGAAANHETLGDRAYAERRFGDALVEYRLALTRRAPDPALRWKAGEAALDAGNLVAAADEFGAMGREANPERRGVAADGLVRVANAAAESGDREALGAALQALQRIAPGRALGSFASQLARTVGTGGTDAGQLTVLMYAAASAPDARAQDSLMYAYGTALRRGDSCEAALPVYESLVRRQRDPAVTAAARDGLVSCALQLGQRARDANSPTAAEQWFRLAVSWGEEGPGVRLAYVGLGDIRFALGDLAGAIDAYEQARAGLSPGDSVYAIVAERLNRIASPGPDIP